MTSTDTAAALRDPIGDTGGRFMLDGAAGDEQPALFRAWRSVPWPTEPIDARLHGVHLMRELRGGAHVTAIREAGVDPHTAVVLRAGTSSAELFGWSGPHPDPEPAQAAGIATETDTNDRVAAVLGVLSDDEQRELVELANVAART